MTAALALHEDERGVWVPRWMLVESPSGNAAVVFAQIAWLFQPGLRGLPRATFVERGGEQWLAITDAELGEQVGVSDDAARRARIGLTKANLIAAKSAKVDGTKCTLIRPTARALDSAEAREGYSAEARNPLFRGSAESASYTSEKEERRERRDAARLCSLLAELMVANGCRPPTITETWLADMDRLIRLDGRTPEQVENAIRWCQADSFWRGNVLSPRKLREKYDQLRLAAKARQSTGNGNGHAASAVLSDESAALVLEQYAKTNGHPRPAAGSPLPLAELAPGGAE